MDDPDRFAEILDHLEAENMSLRLRILDILKWMEEAVSDQVACERRLSEVDAQRCSLETELDAVRQSRADIDVHRRSLEAELGAIHQSRSWRAMNPLRKLYARTRAMGARQ